WLRRESAGRGGRGGGDMGCFPALLARVAIFATWIATPWVGRAFHGGVGGWLFPLLGPLFLAVAALAFVVVSALGNGVTGGAWFWVLLAFLFDLTLHGAHRRARRIVRGRAGEWSKRGHRRGTHGPDVV